MKENAETVVSSVRRIPESVKPKLKEVLDRLIEKNVIEPVDYAIDWVNNIVLVEKTQINIFVILMCNIVLV